MTTQDDNSSLGRPNKNRSKITRRHLKVALLLVMVLAVAAPRLWAHIIPPENLHPVAEAYRRALFVLNLNPVVWEQVRSDTDAIGDYWKQLDGVAAAQFQTDVSSIIRRASVDEPLPRREAAAQMFRKLTSAVTTIVRHHIEAARAQTDEPKQARKQLRQAQGVWAAFAPTLAAADPEGYRQLGLAWLGLSSSLGSGGLLDYGVVPADLQRFDLCAGQLLSYNESNFGRELDVVPGRRLAPWPVRSRTFDPQAKLPVRLPPGNNINKQIPRPRQILNMAARGVDERETTLIALGDMAFDSAFLVGEPMRSLGMSCNSCHNKSITNPNLIIPGLSSRPGTFDVSNSYFAPHANNGVFDPVDIPDLRGIRFTAPYGRNGRFTSLREFVRNGIVNEFNGPEPDPVVLDGLIAYMNEFDFLTNPALNKDGTLNDKAPAPARRGEKLFHRTFAQMANKSCATCHIPSSHFLDRKTHDIGSVRGYEPDSQDRHLDTPTLLGIKYTAPYFHDASQPTLRSVVDWFNDTYKLKLKPQEVGDLTAYVETVGDGVDAYEDTVYYLDAEMEEFIFFLSAFEFLEERNKDKLMRMTFQTVALEIRNHKWELQDWSVMPLMDRMAEIMDEAHAANLAGDSQAVRRKVQEYRKLYAENVDILK